MNTFMFNLHKELRKDGHCLPSGYRCVSLIPYTFCEIFNDDIHLWIFPLVIFDGPSVVAAGTSCSYKSCRGPPRLCQRRRRNPTLARWRSLIGRDAGRHERRSPANDWVAVGQAYTEFVCRNDGWKCV